jgi:hypothetical protein
VAHGCLQAMRPRVFRPGFLPGAFGVTCNFERPARFDRGAHLSVLFQLSADRMGSLGRVPRIASRGCGISPNYVLPDERGAPLWECRDQRFVVLYKAIAA